MTIFIIVQVLLLLVLRIRYYITLMKVAVVITGNLRHFEYSTASVYSQIADRYDADVFAYTDTNDFYHNGKHYVEHESDEEARNMITDIIQSTFRHHLKGLTVDSYDKDLFPTIEGNKYHEAFLAYPSGRLMKGKNSKQNIMNMLYKAYGGYQLLCKHEEAEGIKYDIIIKTRFDSVLNDIVGGVDITQYDYSNNLICSGNRCFIYDHAVIGNRYIMDKYCSYYLTISPNIPAGVIRYWNSDDISDSTEYGHSYLVSHVHGYNIKYVNIDFRSRLTMYPPGYEHIFNK